MLPTRPGYRPRGISRPHEPATFAGPVVAPQTDIPSRDILVPEGNKDLGEIDISTRSADYHVVDVNEPASQSTSLALAGNGDWHIQGSVTPTLTLDASHGFYFEPHVLLWKQSSVTVGLRGDGGVMSTLSGMVKRSVAGVDALLAQANGTGRFCLSLGHPGGIHAVPMARGSRVQVRDKAFLAATEGLRCGFQRIAGLGNVLFGGSGLFVGNFEAERDGLLFVHVHGDLMIVELDPNESIDVITSGWSWKDAGVDMTTVSGGLTTALMGTGSLILHRFTGPGRVALQSGRPPKVENAG